MVFEMCQINYSVQIVYRKNQDTVYLFDLKKFTAMSKNKINETLQSVAEANSV